ncbi:MAG TPA: NADH-quinone oxidoreductase subunit NuoE [Bacillota bacterium]|jgi:NADH-quinone oxidoreductase subunit E/NADP-reducing hydrogenase subunit HndA|nr:NADH-quinone oxidoreductase subunit NuoE [Peptococcaceae bacterium]HPZ42905.1 NADH-quinone oxidoreductase subunit NuoE [Bacillota bacterium]HQD75402.1 NADH-quinone oxidoreductase subunit NuoE [Bacillota bacterium]HUM58153.1 NADH-quinone oxidoreductase subunit NuoE [Bacillota bacterium]
MATCSCGCGEDELTKQLDKIIDPYRGQPGGLIQVLTRAQELIGYLPKWTLIRIAKALGLSLQDVYGVATFYAFFSLIPRGRHKISVCAGTACYVKGTNMVVKTIRGHLGIKPGQTTPDSRFTLEIVRCIGACGLAPAMIIDGKDVHGRLEPEQIPQILEQYA